MNEEENDPNAPKPSPPEQRTVFIPSGQGFPPSEPNRQLTVPPRAPDPLPELDEPKTETPGAPLPPPPPLPPVYTAPPEPSGERATSYGAGAAGFAPRADGKGIQVGDVLNHIFEVKRFIARGGMGEVFEGMNITSDERVAIKVMLPALAADPNVIAMFRKEARTLTRLQHEALVQYRVLAQEPQLGVLYIVTEFIDGSNLADMLGSIHATPKQLVALLRRLASGLASAHALGAIHRDISPDNVLLQDAKLERAKIIDFGIAKDLDPGSATIVGDGFAGKLAYVAPEQLGDFGRSIGPWTDVYSLALVIMAVALGRNVRMGGSLVDAVDKRRAGPDLSEMPDEIRPVLELMLRANPIDRLQSMEAVIAELDRIALPPPGPGPDDDDRDGGTKSLPFIIGGVIAALLVAVGVWWFVLSDPKTSIVGSKGSTMIGPVDTRDPIELARNVVDSTVPSVSCTWLQVVDITKSDHGPLVKLTGVAGDPSAAQNEISRALSQAKISGANLDSEDVSPITQSGCAVLDTYRQIRAPTSTRLTVPQRKFEMRMQPNDATQSGYPGENAATVVLQINVGDPKTDFALVGLEPSGVIDAEWLGPEWGVVGRKELQKAAKELPRLVVDQGGDHYRMQLEVNHSGWSGVILLTGKGPFPKTVIGPPLGARGPNWVENFVKMAAQHGWQAEMLWFKVVDDVRE